MASWYHRKSAELLVLAEALLCVSKGVHHGCGSTVMTKDLFFAMSQDLAVLGALCIIGNKIKLPRLLNDLSLGVSHVTIHLRFPHVRRGF